MNIESQASISELLRRYDVEVDTWGPDMCETGHMYSVRLSLSNKMSEMSVAQLDDLENLDNQVEQLWKANKHLIGADEDRYGDITFLSLTVEIIKAERAAKAA